MTTPVVKKIGVDQHTQLGKMANAVEHVAEELSSKTTVMLINSGVSPDIAASVTASGLLKAAVATFYKSLLAEMTDPDSVTTYAQAQDLRAKGEEALTEWLGESINLHRSTLCQYMDERAGTEQLWMALKKEIEESVAEGEANFAEALNAEANELRTEYFALLEVDTPNQAQVDRMVEIAHWFTDNGLAVVVN